MNSEIFYEHFTRINKKSNMPFLGAVSTSKAHETLYFHIGKTGGSSIHKALVDNGYDDNILANRSVYYEAKKEYFKGVANNFYNYFKFTFVRNKFEQLVSLYHYDKNGGILGSMSFDSFIKDLVAKDEGLYGEWLDQYHLTHIDGECIFDYIGKYHEFQESVDHIMDNIGLPRDCVPRVNVTKRDRSKHFSEYYNKETEAIVREKFAKEIEFFGFEL